MDEDTKPQVLKDEYWTMDRVIRWLESQDFQRAIDIFKTNNICGKAFVELDTNYLLTLPNELLPETEKRRLVYAIKSLLPSDEQYYRASTRQNRLLGERKPSQPNLTPQTPLIPERKSSNNEQVMDWMKTFNIPKRPLAASTARRPPQRVLSPVSPRIPQEQQQDGTWKLARRRVAPPPIHQYSNDVQQSIHVTRDSDTFHSLQVTGMHDPRLIKNSIIRKLGLEGNCDRYYFFHENGKNTDKPLTDNELSHLCQISDHSSTNRILVKPLDYKMEQYRAYSKNGTNCYDFAVKPSGYQRPLHTSRSHHYLGSHPDQSGANEFDANRTQYYSNGPAKVSPISYDENKSDGYFEKGPRKPSVDMNADNHNRVWGSQSQRSSTSSTDTSHPSESSTSGKSPALWPIHQEPDSMTPHHQKNQHQTVDENNSMQKSQSLWAIPPQTKPKMVSSSSLWAVAPSTSTSEKLNPSPSLWAVPPPKTDVTSPVNAKPSLWAVAPAKSDHAPSPSPSTSLWAVPPTKSDSPLPTTNKSTPSPSSSLWAVPPKSEPLVVSPTNAKPSLWAVPPSKSEPNVALLNKPSSLWAIPQSEPPMQQFGAENLNLHPSISGDTRRVKFSDNKDQAMENKMESLQISPKHEENNGLSIDIPARQQQEHSEQPTPISASSLSPINDPNNIENWAERPTVEKLYKDIDKYLPGHDLDKEIIVDNPTIVNQQPPGRHKKSIRIVVNEAHRNWRTAVNVIKANNNLLRRRSTKMWHRNVEQVKPGMRATVVSNDVPKAKKLQWIKGELIGKGSFGKVYHALNVEVGEWIAVKQVDLPTTKADYSNPQLRETKDALFREISLLEDLDNEYIVQYLGYDVDEEEGRINIFLEYVPGGSIATCLTKTGKFEDPLVRFFTRQILMGLAYLHNRNVLHRDIKAGNILLNQNGVCKITDFGLSKLSGQEKAYDPHSNNSVMRGTVFWMAPEVVKGTNYNAKVDIWSLGCTVIEMLTGDHPWLDLNMLAALYSLGKYQAPPIPEGIPQDTHDFLSKCFIINPEDRPTAEELLNHEFVQQDTAFEFKKYMKKVELERRASKSKPIPTEN